MLTWNLKPTFKNPRLSNSLHKLLLCSLLVFSFLLLNACSSNNKTSGTIYVFGTLVEISVYNTPKPQAQQAIKQVEQRFNTFHKEWHAWEQGGIVAKINQAIAKNQSLEVAPSVKNFIIKSQQLSQQSQGLFDPGIGSLIALWGFHKESWQGPPPSKLEIKNWLSNPPSIKHVKFDGLNLSSSNPKVQLDFGGNAKGLAIDIAIDTLKAHGINNALVSIGGDMKAIGSKTSNQGSVDNQDWQIGIQSPQTPQQAIAKVALQGGESIVTSGDYQRFFEWQGQHFSHIINPKTGYPANTFSSVTVIDKDATKADAAATALMIAGPKNWQAIAKSMQVTHVMCIDHQGKITQTPAMQKRTQILAN